MATVTIAVNGVPVEKYLKLEASVEKSVEIQNFLRDELRSMRFSSHRHITSGGVRNSSKPVDVGNGSIRFK
jgi:hypothetical protein